MEFLSETDHSWVLQHLSLTTEQQAEATIEEEDLSKAGGLSAAMRALWVRVPSLPDRFPRRFILKRTRTGTEQRSKELGCPREASFYNQFAATLRAAGCPIPEIVFAYGDMNTGDKVLLLEDLSGYGIQSGYFFGPGSPHNWGQDLVAKTSHVPNRESLTAAEVARSTFVKIAEIHRQFWQDESLLQFDWLRGSDWLKGEGLDTWQASQNTVLNAWKAEKEKIANNTSGIKWDSNLVACIDASMAKIDWNEYQQQIHSRAWTLVHGDFHPANALWCWHNPAFPHSAAHGSGRSVLLDWEVVGLGSGAQDIAQYLISHMNPEERRSVEKSLVESYYSALTAEVNGKQLVVDYSFEQCWKDYYSGGAERWIWLMALLTQMCPPMLNQYFQDQVSAFLNDHGITPETVGMPRV